MRKRKPKKAGIDEKIDNMLKKIDIMDKRLSLLCDKKNCALQQNEVDDDGGDAQPLPKHTGHHDGGNAYPYYHNNKARQRSMCKECGGGSICQHNRQRSTCKTCKADKDDSMPPDLEEL